MRRSQVSIFIILGLLLLMVAIILITFNQRIEEFEIVDDFESNAEVQSVEVSSTSFIDSCLESVTEDSLISLMNRGGQSRLKVVRDEPNDIFPFGNVLSHQYIYHGIENFVPVYYVYNAEIDDAFDVSYTIDQIEVQLEDMILLRMPYCLKGFETFIDQGQDVYYSGHNVDATIHNDSGITIDYSVDGYLWNGEKSANLDTYHYETVSNLNFYYSIVRDIIHWHSRANNTMNGFPFMYVNYLSDSYDLKIIDFLYPDSMTVLSLLKESLSPKYPNTFDTFNVAFKYDWVDELNPYFDGMDSMPLTAEFNWSLPEDVTPVTIVNLSDYTWDVSSYFSTNNDYFNIYADTFKISLEGVITHKQMAPKIGSQDVIVEGYSNLNTGLKTTKKFRINTIDKNYESPFVKIINKSVAYRGFDYYQKIWAIGSQDKIPLYKMELPTELKNMSCNGYLDIDLFTGEIFGFVTADPGIYELNVTVFQYLDLETISPVTFPLYLEVRGDYVISSCE